MFELFGLSKRYHIYPPSANFDGMKINGVLNYQPSLQPEDILKHVALSLINSYTIEDFHKYALDFITIPTEE